MVVPAYTDISHFRAPYKNAYIAGFGGFGADPAVSKAPPGVAILNVADKRGYYFVKQSVRGPLLKQLETYLATIMPPLPGKGQQTAIVPFTDAQLAAAAKDKAAADWMLKSNARAWVEKKVGEGGVVFMPNAAILGVVTKTPIPKGLNNIICYPVGSQQARDLAKIPVSAIIAGDPEEKPLGAMLGPLGIAALAVAAVGGIYLVARGRRRRRAAEVPMRF